MIPIPSCCFTTYSPFKYHRNLDLKLTAYFFNSATITKSMLGKMTI